jgi:starvation-inducible DNA-binding protein
MKIQIGISEKNASSIADLLNTLLADEYLLTTKTKFFHWNVTGPNFIGLHEFFGQQYADLDNLIDLIAERIRKIGHYPSGSMTDFLKMTHLSETKNVDLNSKAMIQQLLQDHEIIIRWLRSQSEAVSEKLKDQSTGDFMLDIMRRHEKMAWMLRAFLG